MSKAKRIRQANNRRAAVHRNSCDGCPACQPDVAAAESTEPARETTQARRRSVLSRVIGPRP